KSRGRCRPMQSRAGYRWLAASYRPEKAIHSKRQSVTDKRYVVTASGQAAAGGLTAKSRCRPAVITGQTVSRATVRHPAPVETGTAVAWQNLKKIRQSGRY